MTAITLMPGVHLVGAGASGVDFSKPLVGNIYVVDGRQEWAVVDMGRSPTVGRVIKNIQDLGSVGDFNLERPATLIVADSGPAASRRISTIRAAFPDIRVHVITKKTPSEPAPDDSVIELGGRTLTLLRWNEQDERGACCFLSDSDEDSDGMPMMFASRADP